MAKLTKAQRRFLDDLHKRRTRYGSNPGFSPDTLTGSENAMAARLETAGLVASEFFLGDGSRWVITDAGRLALSDQGGDG